MDKENQWSEINKDVADIAKVKSKIDEEDLVEDLKESLRRQLKALRKYSKLSSTL